MPTRRRWTGLAKLVGTLLAGALMVVLAFRLDEDHLPTYTEMGLAAIVAVGLSLLMGFAGQISLGQGRSTPSARTRPGSSPSGSIRTTASSTPTPRTTRSSRSPPHRSSPA